MDDLVLSSQFIYYSIHLLFHPCHLSPVLLPRAEGTCNNPKAQAKPLELQAAGNQWDDIQHSVCNTATVQFHGHLLLVARNAVTTVHTTAVDLTLPQETGVQSWWPLN